MQISYIVFSPHMYMYVLLGLEIIMYVFLSHMLEPFMDLFVFFSSIALKSSQLFHVISVTAATENRPAAFEF